MSIGDLFTGIDIVKPLVQLDLSLSAPAEIILAGSAVPILAGCEFRHTADIDFAFLPSPEVCAIINQAPELRRVFDFNAQGIIGLLEDTEDRLVDVELGLARLTVKRLSLMDWVVSKLASPKLEDTLNVKEVTLDMLLNIERNFHLYCGVSTDRAFSDLKYLIREMKERKEQSGGGV